MSKYNRPFSAKEERKQLTPYLRATPDASDLDCGKAIAMLFTDEPAQVEQWGREIAIALTEKGRVARRATVEQCSEIIRAMSASHEFLGHVRESEALDAADTAIRALAPTAKEPAP